MCVAGVSHTRDALLEVIHQELDMRQSHNNLMQNATFVSRNGTSIDSAFISPNMIYYSLFAFIAYLFLHLLIFLA